MTVEHEPQVLSMEAAMQFMGSVDLFVEISEMMLAELPELMGQIESHAAEGDLSELSRTAHRLKGNFGIVAAEQAQAAAKDLEDSARAGDAAAASSAKTALVAAVANVVPLLEQHVAAAKS